MLKFIFRRLLVAIPTILVILLISFMISRSVPGDPVYLEMDAQFREGTPVSPERRAQEYARLSHEKGLDLPIFYFSMSSLAESDTLHRILELGDRGNLAEMINLFGDWPQIEAYYHAVRLAAHSISLMDKPADVRASMQEAQRTLEELRRVCTAPEVHYRLRTLDSLEAEVPLLRDSLHEQLALVASSFAAVEAKASRWRCYVPVLHWHGLQNQFHHWFSRMICMDFGRSYSSKQQVTKMIKDALPWTMFMGFFSYAIAFMVAIPVGVYSVRKRHQWQDRAVSVGLFLLHSVPVFVAAMLAMMLLCNPEYLQLFPTSGVLSDGAEKWPFGYRMMDYAYHLTLPTLLFSYHSITFFSRQLRGSMLEAITMDYVRTARAKGLSERTVVWRHVLRNSLLPMITAMAGILPSMVGGAVITEFIFSVPGMGLLTLDAAASYDHPVLIAVFTLTSIATVLGVLLTDILYAWADPRISFVK